MLATRAIKANRRPSLLYPPCLWPTMPVAAPRRDSACPALMVLLATLCVGCGQTKYDPHYALEPRFVERHGQLDFVNNVQAGCRLATERGMPCLFFFTAEWCTYCERMADTAFADPTVGALGRNFVCVLVDADREPELCRYFSVTGFPTIEFVTPRGHSLHRLVGQQSPADLAAGMHAALGRYAWLSETKLR